MITTHFDRVPEAHIKTNDLRLEASAMMMMVVLLGTQRNEEGWGGWWMREGAWNCAN